MLDENIAKSFSNLEFYSRILPGDKILFTRSGKQICPAFNYFNIISCVSRRMLRYFTEDNIDNQVKQIETEIRAAITELRRLTEEDTYYETYLEIFDKAKDGLVNLYNTYKDEGRNIILLEVTWKEMAKKYEEKVNNTKNTETEQIILKKQEDSMEETKTDEDSKNERTSGRRKK